MGSARGGQYNTGIGISALRGISEPGEIHSFNTAVGGGAMSNIRTGQYNTATGVGAHAGCCGGPPGITGDRNTANGAYSLYSNLAGDSNTANGSDALYSNIRGSRNVANGFGALRNNLNGDRNVGLGYQAGSAVSGNDNIVIGAGNKGQPAENGVIRIGISTHQTKTFVAGIRDVQTGLAGAIQVFIDANGQLGTIMSSHAVKEDIRSMGNVSDRLSALRPVTFRYRKPYEDGTQPIEFGLIAEEVAEVFPELVVLGTDGTPETVAYHLLPTLLLNELQVVQQLNRQQSEQLAIQADRLAEVDELKRQVKEMRAMLAALQPKVEGRQLAISQ